MNTDKRRSELNQITEKIIGCAYQVSKILGCGFLEKVYENALAHEMRRQVLKVEQQVAVPVHYDDIIAGDYIADCLVEGSVLIEIKAVSDLSDIHKAQCLNYLHATGLQVCLLINFGKPRIEVKRIVRNF